MDRNDATIREFYALYAIHREALEGILPAQGTYMAADSDGISDQNFAALALTFQVGEALADLDDETPATRRRL